MIFRTRACALGVLLRRHHGRLPADHGGNRVDPGPEVPVHRRPGAAGQRVPDGRAVPRAAGRGPAQEAPSAERPAPPLQPVARGSGRRRRVHTGRQRERRRGRRGPDGRRRRVRHGEHTAAEHHGGHRRRWRRRRHAPPAVPGQRVPVREPEGQRALQLQRGRGGGQQPSSLRNRLRRATVSDGSVYGRVARGAFSFGVGAGGSRSP